MSLSLYCLIDGVAFSEDYDAKNQPVIEQPFIDDFSNTVSDNQLPDAKLTQEQNIDNSSLPVANNTVDSTPAEVTEIRPQTTNPSGSNRYITVTTDTVKVTIDKLGGDIVEVAMLKHLSSLDEDATPLRLLEKNNLRTYIAQSGLIGKNGPDSNGLKPFYSTTQKDYTLGTDGTVDVCAKLYRRRRR